MDVLGLGLSARKLADIDVTLGILFFLQAAALLFAGRSLALDAALDDVSKYVADRGDHPSPCASACSSSFNLVHLYLGYRINPDALVSFSVENLFNQQYSRYLDVAPSPGHG